MKRNRTNFMGPVTLFRYQERNHLWLMDNRFSTSVLGQMWQSQMRSAQKIKKMK
ncbi:hypothetical protein ACVWYG_002086 [Pedobacter sp. UYEF25]